MCRLLDEAMDAGGCGWSAQRLHPSGGNCVQRDFDGTPMVTDLMHNETALALARVLRSATRASSRRCCQPATRGPTCAIWRSWRKSAAGR